MRPFVDDFNQFASLLILIDMHAAKAYYAKEMDGVMPILSDVQEIDIKKAYHPLLYLSNKRKKNSTYPQDVHLHTENRPKSATHEELVYCKFPQIIET